MKSVWRKHLITCLVLGLLAIPIYFLDRALLRWGRQLDQVGFSGPYLLELHHAHRC